MSKTILNFNSDMGHWTDEWSDMGKEHTYTIGVLTGSSKREDVFTIEKKDYIPQNGDRIYFLPGVNVPRVKFKNLCDEKGIRTVRDVAKANIFVANNNSYSKLLDFNWDYKVKTDDFKALVNMSEFNSKLDTFHYKKIVDALEFYTEQHVYTDRPTAMLINVYVRNKKEFRSDSERIWFIKEDYVDIMSAINGLTIYDEETIIDQLNGDDAAIIDDQIYKQLSTMLDSSDNDNKILAMEVMANCKYSASLVHLMMLFYNHGSAIYNMHTKNHVNFKSLLSWLDITASNPHIDMDSAVKILREKGQLTPDKLDKVLGYIQDDVVRNGNSRYFKMKSVTIDPELLEEMNVNYSYQTQADFVPSVPESEINTHEDVNTDEVREDLIPDEKPAEDADIDSIEEIPTNEAEEDQIVLVPEPVVSESELNKPENDSDTVSNNNQIEETNGGDDFEWF
jgi:hypothetical protein